MPVSIVCPYCRTPFSVDDPAVHRAVCPRCGETVPVRPAEAGADVNPVAIAPTETLTSPRWFKPTFFASCITALVILVIGLWWVFSDPKRPGSNPTARDPDGTRPPSALTGVG